MINAVYTSWKKTIEAIIDDASAFERVNQWLSVRKQGYKNIREYKKAMLASVEQAQGWVNDAVQIVNEAKWLYEKFGEGEYRDISGLCKMASRGEVAEKNYSLTPGAYVGVAAVEDDGVDFAQRMCEIHRELLALQAESNELMQNISKNMKEMGL